jgi:protein-S-isoprenylcysteine O-methyltransferase Ste14
MVESSGSVPSSLVIEPQGVSKLLHAVAQFLIRRRILVSGVLFGLLVARDIVYGFRPHDLLNVRDPYGIVGGLLVCLGLALRSWAVGVLRKDRELTTTGPYRLIRNPLYVGSFLMMFGFCALLGDPKSIWFILGPVLLVYIVKVRQEERVLAALFPAEWAAYARRTPRFFPFILSSNLSADWRASQWMRSREYQALGATLFALVAIQVWHTLG